MKRIDIDFKEIKRLYDEEHLLLTEILKRLNVSYDTIKRRVKEYNIKFNTVNTPHNINRKYILDIDKFDKTWSEYKAYFLGLCYTDGTVVINPLTNSYVTRISLQTQDKVVLEYIIKYVFNNALPLHQTRENQYGVSIYSKDFLYLMADKYGIIPRKTYESHDTVTFDVVPEKYKIAYIRGVYDGDGAIQFNFRLSKGFFRVVRRLRIINTNKLLLEAIDNFLKSNDIITKGHINNKKNKYVPLYTYVITHFNSLISLLTKIYVENNHISIPRKQELAYFITKCAS